MQEEEVNYSIIIPHFTSSNTHLLERCVASIPERNDVQVLIVDNSPIEIDENIFPQRKNVKILYSEKGKGAGCARNMGLRYAKGKWLLFADSDDFFEERAFDFFDIYKASLYDIVYFQVKGVDSNSLLPVKRGSVYNKYVNDYLKHLYRAKEQLGFMYHVPWGKMIKKNIVDLHNLQFEEVSYSNDIMFSNLCGYYAKNIHADQNITYCITDREGSLTKQMRKEPLRCRFSVEVRRNKFLFDKKKYLCIAFSRKRLLIAYKYFGINEVLKYLKIAKENKVTFYQLLLMIVLSFISKALTAFVRKLQILSR